MWVWERSSDRTSWTPIQGVTESAYTPTQADETHHLRAIATYTDAHGPNKTASAEAAEAVAVGHTTSYTDVTPEGTHTPSVQALAADGVFVDTGCGPELFCPDQPIQRWVMAVWLIRALGQEPTITGTSRFHDIDQGQWWIRYAEELAERQITLGCATDPPEYCPDQSVTRAQMASFLVRAFNLPPAETPAGFTDTEGNTHAANIDALGRRRDHLRLRHRPAPLLPQPDSNPSTDGHLPQPSPQSDSTGNLSHRDARHSLSAYRRGG